MSWVTLTVDTANLEKSLAEAFAELSRRMMEDLERRYDNDIEALETDHEAELTVIRDEVSQLEDELEEANETIKALESQVEELEEHLAEFADL
ncbi:putative nucleic acid-binding Zn-ribbon protein [Oceanisphaera litoralis]|uniref:hypothetical protein n=1 Tax=Oceanisphaera litoralis TaxID=225144 RepID=UPI00195F1315|nr:hypothetical protein [Oceanisphaera litoralis]MBM7454503.1 putative nucleic acid-binding Zn-ribbon protein [Oceanisphaera litoralis]